MSARKVTPAKMVAAQKQFNEHMREWARVQNADRFKDCPIPEPRTIGQQVDESEGVRTPLEVPAQLVEWQHEGGVMIGTPPKGGAYQSLHDDFAAMARNDNGIVALVEGLRALATNPEIIAGEESGAFISGILEAVEGSYQGELLALLPSVSAALRVGGKHKKTDDVKEPILSKCRAYKEAHPTHGNGKIAKEIAPDAFKMNQSAGHPFGWKNEIDAYEAIKGWLTPSKSK
ncbi:hypothetical protein [Acidithiobacillus ferridurans]|jgi:hypothetical protein|uniref:hypothetical protein n=1 Tax=Acidithiobacillus ferridurans TaxID=1232575 RepID=UPI001C078FA2|nr:hypothetical protein [Acidithiobacillus ferridurans]MBU2734108.1 hypothetical protein [Acidithiobacillus ferridurans]